MNRAIILFFLLESVFTVAPSAGQHSSATSITATVDPTKKWNTWDGWGSSLAWWARAIGGTRNAGIYADLIYTTSDISVAEEKYPGLGFNIARYNVGGRRNQRSARTEIDSNAVVPRHPRLLDKPGQPDDGLCE